MRQVRLSLAFYGQYLKSLMAFRWDFLLNLTGVVIGQVLNVLMLSAIFARIPHLAGWRYEEVLFIFGFAQLTLSLFYLLGTSLGTVNHLILDGTLDQFLLRPVDPLVQILAQEVGYQQLSAVATSVCILAYAGHRLDLVWSWWQPLVLPIFVISGFFIYLGLALIMASLGFWFTERNGLVWPVMSAGDFAQYPVTIYSRPIQILVTWILPFAFTAFYPATLLMGLRTYAGHAWLTPFVAVTLMRLGYELWRRGLRTYASTGS